MLAAALAARLPQIAVLVAQQGEGAPTGVVALAAGFWLVYLAAGLAQRRRGGAKDLANALVLVSASFAASSAFALLNGTLLGIDREGLALLAVASVYGIVSAGLLKRDRDGSALTGSIALALSALGFAELLGGDTLAIAWAARAALVAWLAVRLRELRYGAAALAYLALAATQRCSSRHLPGSPSRRPRTRPPGRRPSRSSPSPRCSSPCRPAGGTPPSRAAARRAADGEVLGMAEGLDGRIARPRRPPRGARGHAGDARARARGGDDVRVGPRSR